MNNNENFSIMAVKLIGSALGVLMRFALFWFVGGLILSKMFHLF